MKLVRILLRLALLSLAAAAFAGLTWMYGNSVSPPSPDRGLQEWLQHRPSAPDAWKFLELVPGGAAVAIFAVAGRILFRLRLSPASRGEGQPISLGLLPRRSRQGD